MAQTTKPVLSTDVPTLADEENFDANFDGLMQWLPPAIDFADYALTTASAKATSAVESAEVASQSELNAAAAANFKGAWAASRVVGGITLNGYNQGESTLGSDGMFYVCLVTHTTAQNPVSTTGYWNISVPAMVAGNINKHYLELNFSSAKKLIASYSGEFKFERLSGATHWDNFGFLKYFASYSGTATAGSLFHLENSAGGWTVGALEDYVIKITTGSIVEYRWVVGNTATSITLNKPLSTPVTASTTYAMAKPRFEENGLLIEESLTNLALYSEDLTNAYWAKTGVTVTGNNAADPYGTTLADTMTQDSSTGTHQLENSFSATLGDVYSGSAVITPGGNTKYFAVYIGRGENKAVFDLQSGTVYSVTGCTASIKKVSSGYLVKVNGCVIGTTSSANHFTFRFIAADGTTLSFAGDGTSTAVVTCMNLTATARARSYVPATTASATKAADNFDINPSAGLSAGNDFSVVVDVNCESDLSSPNNHAILNIIAANDAATRVLLFHKYSANAFVAYVGANSIGTTTFASKYRAAITSKNKGGDIRIFQNGKTLSTGTNTNTVATPTTFQIGRWGSSAYLNGHISYLRLYNFVLSSTEVAYA